ncbi:MAG: glycosyltransferase family 9 protein [Candidatus Zixiibacteriota bacterium]
MRRFRLRGDERVLLIRTDHIGDVLLSLPVATALKRKFPALKVDMLVQPNIVPLLQNHPDLSEAVPCVSENEPRSSRGAFSQRKRLRANRYDVAIILHPTCREAFLTFISHIPIRIGTGYRAYSFLFNFKVYEHRKHNLKHESDYNLGLLRPLGIDSEKLEKPLPEVYLLPQELEEAEATLNELGVDFDRPLVMMHPGSAGSSLRWPAKRFAELSDLIVEKAKVQVLVSWGPGEEDLVKYFLRLVSLPVFSLPKETDLRSLAGIYKQATLFVGNSTGPMHLAAAVGLPVIAIFSPTKANSETRWGPLGENHTVFKPPIEACDDCRGEKCEYFNCMDRVLPEVVFDRVCDFVLESAQSEGFESGEGVS